MCHEDVLQKPEFRGQSHLLVGTQYAITTTTHPINSCFDRVPKNCGINLRFTKYFFEDHPYERREPIVAIFTNLAEYNPLHPVFRVRLRLLSSVKVFSFFDLSLATSFQFTFQIDHPVACRIDPKVETVRFVPYWCFDRAAVTTSPTH